MSVRVCWGGHDVGRKCVRSGPVLNRSSLACTKKIKLSENDPVLNGYSLACTKKFGLSENGPVLNRSNLVCTKKMN